MSLCQNNMEKFNLTVEFLKNNFCSKSLDAFLFSIFVFLLCTKITIPGMPRLKCVHVCLAGWLAFSISLLNSIFTNCIDFLISLGCFHSLGLHPVVFYIFFVFLKSYLSFL